MSVSYVIYIDEAGDAGLKRTGSEWFVLSALLCHKSYETQLTKIMDEVRLALNIPNRKRPLHYKDLSDAQRIILTKYLAQTKLQAFNTIIYKPSLQGLKNTPSGFENNSQLLYFFATRSLIEVISLYLQNQEKESCGLQILFSRYADLSYKDMSTYLETSQQFSETTIEQSTINVESIKSDTPNKYAGLQFVDTVASSFYNAVRRMNIPNADLHANTLKPTVYNVEEKYLGYGIKIYPENLLFLEGYEWLLSNYR